MRFEHYIRSGQKLLRCGYTTGTCAALAAAGAARLLLTGIAPAAVSLRTPKGLIVEVEPLFCRRTAVGAECAIQKDGGDDADVTTGLSVTASVNLRPTPGAEIEGGTGVGRVTKPGLDQPVGASAINRIPRRMIAEALQAEAEAACYTGGFSVIISIPGGEEAAKRTFNPALGIEGGLSVLGTSGIVEPMSEQALLDTIEISIHQAALQDKRLILAPGNYGLDYLHAAAPELEQIPIVKCSNFIGDALDMAAAAKFEQVLLVGHIGKLVKLAGGVMNTHSRMADCRVELFCAHAAVCGAPREVCAALMDAVTTDSCLEILRAAGMRETVMDSLLAAIQLHLDRRAAEAFETGAVLFSQQNGPLGKTSGAQRLLSLWAL
ncbi:MAG: cobalt-precorrin-5B (C(1))-methyltransferase CbiD [Faecalibacterium sp.]